MPLGGELRVALPSEVGSLDPRAPDANPLVVAQLFEGLVALGANGAAPWLATKWSVGPDQRSWTFALRGGVSFHDGTPLDAAAAAKSLGRANDPLIANVGAQDPSTVLVVLAASVPAGTFLAALASPAYAIVRPDAPGIGTGPFRVSASGSSARPLALERYPQYWRVDAAGTRLPYLDRLTFTPIPDPGTRLAALRVGNVDLVPELALADVPAVRSDPNLQLLAPRADTVLYLGINLSVTPLQDLRVRQAIAQSVNGRTLGDRVYNVTGAAAAQFPPPAMLGYDDSVIEFAKPDASAAKKLLAEANSSNMEIDLWYVLGGPATRPDMRRVAEALAADLVQAGIFADPKTIDPITFDTSVRENRFPLWLGITTATRFDPDELLGAFFIPPALNGKDQPTEGGAWLNPEAAGLLRRARAEPDESKRAELYKQVSKIVQREIPRIPLVWSAAPGAATRKVQNAGGRLFAEIAMGR